MPAASRRLAVLGMGLLAGLFGMVTSAQAQASCPRIQSELASLHNGGGGSGQSAQIQQAISQQNNELARARGAFDRFGCGAGGGGQCGAIIATIGQMENNLAVMQRQLSRAGGAPNNGRRIAELERVFATQCGPNQRATQVAAAPQAHPQQAQPRQRSLLDAIFGTRSQPEPASSVAIVQPQQATRRGFDRQTETVREPQLRSRGGTYRTMCVRTTDGFYWPISFSTTRDRFDEYQGLCAAMCPGTAVELFAYRNPGEQVEAMVSTLTAQPYADQTYAFAYREAFDPDNRCTPSAAVFEDLRGTMQLVAAGSSEPARPRYPQPMARPPMESDPETRVLAMSGMSFGMLASMTRPQGEDPQQMVRAVGPSFGYFTQ